MKKMAMIRLCVAVLVCMLIALLVIMAKHSLAESDRTIERVDRIIEEYGR